MAAKFLVVGTGRCGTEMLVNMFNRHPDLLVFPETMFLFPCIARFGNQKIEVDALMDFALSVSHIDGSSTLKRAVIDAGVPEAALDEILADIRARGGELNAYELLDAIGNRAAVVCKKKYWAEKCPDGGYYIEDIGYEWPDATFINIHRNAVSTALSMRKHPGFRANVATHVDLWTNLAIMPRECIDLGAIAATLGDRPLEEFMDLWGRRILRIEQSVRRLHDPKKAYRIRYEDILTQPKDNLAALCRHVGLAENEEWLDMVAQMVDVSRMHAPDIEAEELRRLYEQAPFARRAQRMLAELCDEDARERHAATPLPAEAQHSGESAARAQDTAQSGPGESGRRKGFGACLGRLFGVFRQSRG